MKNLFLLIFENDNNEKIFLSSKNTLLSAIESCSNDTVGLDLVNVFHTQTEIKIKSLNTLNRIFFSVLVNTPFGQLPYFPENFKGINLQFRSYKQCLEILHIFKKIDKDNLEFEIVPFAEYSNGTIINLKSGYEPAFSCLEFDFDKAFKKQVMLDEYCFDLYTDVGKILDSHGLSIDNLHHTVAMFKRNV
jgi:hypothetical protein